MFLEIFGVEIEFLPVTDVINPFNNLRDRVINGEFAPGQRLRAEKLRNNYNCSAATVREALFRLSTIGLVDFQEQRGFRLPQQSAELLHDLTKFRILIECEGACLSVQNGGIAWEAKLSAAHHKLSHIESRVHSGQRSSDVLALWTAAELEFHTTLIEACDSSVLKQTHLDIYHRFRQQLITQDAEFIFVPENIAQHKGILDAALQHDESLIRTRISDHLSRNLLPGKGSASRSPSDH